MSLRAHFELIPIKEKHATVDTEGHRVVAPVAICTTPFPCAPTLESAANVCAHALSISCLSELCIENGTFLLESDIHYQAPPRVAAWTQQAMGCRTVPDEAGLRFFNSLGNHPFH